MLRHCPQQHVGHNRESIGSWLNECGMQHRAVLLEPITAVCVSLTAADPTTDDA